MPSVAYSSHAQPLEIPRESGQPVAVGDREQRTHLRGSSSGRFVGAAEAGPGTETIPWAAPGLARLRPSIPSPMAYSDGLVEAHATRPPLGDPAA